jgi:predicted nucleic acid-binding protein
VALICDTGGLYALYDADDAQHSSVKAVIAEEAGPLFLPVILLAEIDYLITTRLGVEAELDFLEGVTEGEYSLVGPTPEDLVRCRELVTQYRDLPLGLADASVLATAERLGIPRVLTLHHPHFRALRPKDLPYLILLPADQI